MRAPCSIDASGLRAISRDATIGRLGVAPEVQQVVRQHQLAGTDHHAIRIRLDEPVERLCRRIQIALVVLREREIEQSVVAERGKIIGGKFEIGDRAQVVVTFIRTITVEERRLPVGGRRERRGSRSGRGRLGYGLELIEQSAPERLLNRPERAPTRIRQEQHTTPGAHRRTTISFSSDLG